MDVLWLFIGLAIGLSVGVVLAWLFVGVRSTATRVELETKLRASEDAQQRLSQTFANLSSEALRSNNETFLQLAQQALGTHLVQAQGDLDLRKQAVEALIKPLSEALHEMERERQTAYGGLRQLTERLSQTTMGLAQALQKPQGRGRWGELTLRRVVELAGMVEHCDFVEQPTLDTQEGLKRPDMVVYLPNQRRIAVDAKTPLVGYLEAVEASTEEARSLALKRHAQQVRERARDLSGKAYWDSLGYTPEFVVLFLPGEPFLSTALQEDPQLLEQLMADKVVLATPSTLIALLQAVAYGWRQEQLTQNAQEISRLGRELHDRISVWARHLTTMGSSLSNTVRAYNQSVGSLEHSVLPSARRIKGLGVSSDREVREVPRIEDRVRALAGSDEDATGLDSLGSAGRP